MEGHLRSKGREDEAGKRLLNHLLRRRICIKYVLLFPGVTLFSFTYIMTADLLADIKHRFIERVI